MCPACAGREEKRRGQVERLQQLAARHASHGVRQEQGRQTDQEELTDTRLHRLFDQADTNKDGVVTKEEVVALAKKLDADGGPGGDRRGPGGPGGRGPGGRGPGGPAGFGGPPQPGQILPTFLQEELKLTADQKKQLEKLQKEVDSGLARILTD